METTLNPPESVSLIYIQNVSLIINNKEASSMLPTTEISYNLLLVHHSMIFTLQSSISAQGEHPTSAEFSLDSIVINFRLRFHLITARGKKIERVAREGV